MMGAKGRRTDVDSTGAAAIQSGSQSRHFPNAPLDACTNDDRNNWQGFIDIDSDPALFSAILEEWGVKGLKVREVFSLEEEGLAFLPKPVHGLIFLFRYRADDVNKQEAACPDHVWFANQLYDKACASVALLNIIANIAGAELGEHIQAFKEFSRDLTPVQRGQAIGSFEFLKRIHNSFARKMDMLDTDLSLENQYDDRNKPKAKPKAKPTNKGAKARVVSEHDYEHEDAAFHFIAFVPVQGQVWKLDGLDRQPQKLGAVVDADWLSLVVPDLGARMAQYEEDQIEFSILAVVQDPICGLAQRLQGNEAAVAAIEGRLSSIKPAWREHIIDEAADGGGATAAATAGGDDRHIANGPTALLPDEIRHKLERLQLDGAPTLLDWRQEMLNEQLAIRAALRDEEQSQAMDRERARERRFDPTPLLHQWLTYLAQKDGVMKELVDDARP